MNPVADTLRSAAVVLLIPGAHAKEAMARGKCGRRTTYDDPTSCRWCASGALAAATPRSGHIYMDAIQALERHLGTFTIQFNDDPNTTPLDMAAAMWAAADRVEQEAKETT